MTIDEFLNELPAHKGQFRYEPLGDIRNGNNQDVIETVATRLIGVDYWAGTAQSAAHDLELSSEDFTTLMLACGMSMPNHDRELRAKIIAALGLPEWSKRPRI